MQDRTANGPVSLTTRGAEAAGTRHQGTFIFSRFVGGAFPGGFLLLITHRLRFARFFFGARFGRGFCPGNAVTQSGFVGAHFAQLALSCLDRGLQPGERLLTLIAGLLKLLLLRLLIVEQRLLLALFLFQLGFLRGDFFARLFQLRNGLLTRLVKIAEIGL